MHLRDDYLKLLRQAVRGRLQARPVEGEITAQELARARSVMDRVAQRYGHLRARSETLPQGREIALALDATTPESIVEMLRRNAPPPCQTLLDEASFTQLERCYCEVERAGVAGDLMECGVWRGGMTIFMRALLRAYGDERRCVWAADSFQGLPQPNAEVSPIDCLSHEVLVEVGAFAVSLKEVKENFRRYGLLDERVRFVEGWFHESLARAPIAQLSILRLDGDYYESTRPALEHLYPRVTPGGFVIIDDYAILAMGARRAVDEYRKEHAITSPLQRINEQSVYWRKPLDPDHGS